ncbi:MAG: hypothetical protein QF886_19210 [Planctomycetota bacterium]|nr:hypothetical protein [Planctomycetota bacterium]
MDEFTYKRWWPLHLRVARGESLSSEEREMYEAGLEELEQEETLKADFSELKEARAKVAQLKAEQTDLQARREQLDAEIEALEAALDEPSRQLLGAEE